MQSCSNHHHQYHHYHPVCHFVYDSPSCLLQRIYHGSVIVNFQNNYVYITGHLCYILCDRSSSISKKFIESHNQKIPLYYCRYQENWCRVSLITVFTTETYSCMVSGEFKKGVVIAPPCLLGNTKVLMYCSMLSKHKPPSRKIALFVYCIAGFF